MLNPCLLLDKSRLPEIFKLRVNCYSNSDYNHLINFEKYPEGWFDKLDQTALHWIILDNDKIIASCRIAIVTDLKDMEEDFLQFGLPQFGQYAFFSRLVILNKYRHLGLTHKLDNARLHYIRENHIKTTLAWARQKRLHSLFSLGFKSLGYLTVFYGENHETVTALKFDNEH